MKTTKSVKQILLLALVLILSACNSEESAPTSDPGGKIPSDSPLFNPSNSTDGPSSGGTSSVDATLVAGQTNVHTVTITNYGTATLYTTSDLDTVCSLNDANNVELFIDDDSGLNLNCSITTDLTPGTYYFAVWGFDSSVAGAYTATLDFVPLTSTETEPNDTISDADLYNPIGLETKTGTVDSATDYDDIFAFTPSVTGNYSVNLTGFTGDLDLYIMDSTSTILTGAYTTATGGSESVSYYMLAGQTYYVTVEAWNAINDGYSLTLISQTTTPSTGTSEAEPNNTTTEANILNVGTVNGVVDTASDYSDIFAFTPAQTDTYTVTLTGFIGDLDLYLADATFNVVYASSTTAANGGSESVTFTMQAGVTYYLSVEAWSSVNDAYSLTIEAQATIPPPAAVTEVESNNTITSANVVNAGTVTGVSDTATDPADIFAFTPTVNGNYNVTLAGFTEDLDLYVTDALGNILISSTSGILGGSESVILNMQAGQTYYLWVDAFSAVNNAYSLTITAQ